MASRVRAALAYVAVLALWLLPLGQCTARNAGMWPYPTGGTLATDPAVALFLVPPFAALVLIFWIALTAVRDGRTREWFSQTLLWLVGLPLVYVASAILLLLAFAFLPNRLNQAQSSISQAYGSVIGMGLAVFIAVPIAATVAAGIAWRRGRSRNRDGAVAASHVLSAGLMLMLAAWLMQSIYFAPDVTDRQIFTHRDTPKPTEVEVTQQLAQETSDTNTQGGLTSTLSVAIAHHDAATARLLIERGAKDADGVALQIAINTQDPEMIRIALTAKPPLNVRGVLGKTPLLSILSERWSSDRKQKEAIYMLIHAGADVNAVDETNRSALDYAKSSHDDYIVDLLRAAGAKERNQPGGQPKFLPPSR